MKAEEKIILYFSLKYNGTFKKIYEALSKKEQVNEERYKEYISKINCQYTTIFSENYPESLKRTKNPPFVLFYYGDINLLEKKMISIAGIKNPTMYGERTTKYFVEELVKEDYVIVSGMYSGIDSIAIEETIKNNGHSIVILGTGINKPCSLEYQHIYEKLKENHLLISESPYYFTGHEEHDFASNRIVTGLSPSLLVTETTLKSESMIAVMYALEQEKEIICVPSKSENRGCDNLISNGAKSCTSISDIFDIENKRMSIEEDYEIE
ncbi:MAG: DNA-protecting protein DprA [Coprobacillus sp.]|nr:DNA-protecting protein DprA [Coprobacillus sp.]